MSQQFTITEIKDGVVIVEIYPDRVRYEFSSLTEAFECIPNVPEFGSVDGDGE